MTSTFAWALLLAGLPLLAAQSDQSNVLFGKPPAKDRNHARVIQGTVRDASDRAIDGAIVSLKNLKTAKTVEFITIKDGGFRFNDLSLDVDYELSALHEALASAPKRVTAFDTRKQVVLTLRLEPKAPANASPAK